MLHTRLRALLRAVQILSLSFLPRPQYWSCIREGGHPVLILLGAHPSPVQKKGRYITTSRCQRGDFSNNGNGRVQMKTREIPDKPPDSSGQQLQHARPPDPRAGHEYDDLLDLRVTDTFPQVGGGRAAAA
jgi:hypothetical protein